MVSIVMMIFCTLFDSYYLDKGLALYRSLERVSKEFKLFVFCFDDKSFEILNSQNLSQLIAIHHSSFETEEYLVVKEERSKAEYCWTCTPRVIEYVMDTYHVDSCTYLDSDLYFYSDPQVLFDEINNSDSDVAIVEHRFKDNSYGRKLEKRNGKYCVQFNYFKNTKNGRRVLLWWKEKCLEWCYDIPDSERMGDQKYLNTWTRDFVGVHEMKHLGGGVAPWNLEKYKLKSIHDDNVIMYDKSGLEFPLVFFHFQNIRYMHGRYVNIKSQTKNKKLKYAIYIPYLIEIEKIRKELEDDYGVLFNTKGIIRSSNIIISFLQKYLASLKIMTLSDVLNLDKLDEYIKK